MQHLIYPSAMVVMVLANLAVPLLVGLGTKLGSSSWWKVGLNAALTTIIGVITSLAGSPESGFDLYATLYAIALSFISSSAAYARIWKPLGIADKVQQKTADFGLGAAA